MQQKMKICNNFIFKICNKKFVQFIKLTIYLGHGRMKDGAWKLETKPNEEYISLDLIIELWEIGKKINENLKNLI